MTIKEAIETVSFELSEVPYISNVALEAMDYLENHPDVVEPVRCWDCKYAKVNGFGDYETLRGCPAFYAGEFTDPDAFCSEGERREAQPDA